MFVDVEKYVDFIIKNKLTQSQFLFLYLIYRKRYDAIKKYKAEFGADDGSMIGIPLRQELIDKGFVEKIGDDDKVSSYKITEKFTSLYLNDIYLATEELKLQYPPFIKINGNLMPLITSDIYQLSGIYGERIDFSVDEHKEVIKDVIYAREKDAIRCNIDKFIRGEMWKSIRPLRLSEKAVPVLKDFDN